ncbi:relaxase/mobilization nuclease domain-containing protein [Campylobacter jejuni]|nr:relaxase/mobilization nuclease domain-containing protein [Campylobacter jejuni]
MSRSIRIFDDEIIAKKVFTKIENASKLPLNYINKNRDKYTKDIKTGKLISKNMFRKNTEVVVKITSGSKNSQALSKHLDYISRDGNVELITNDFDRYAGEDEILEVKRIFKNEGSPIPLYKEGAKEKRHTINMVFSMKEHSTTPKEKLQQAVITTLKRMYPNNFFVVAFHNDTDNPHCHVCLKVADKNGKRINPKKADFKGMSERGFARSQADWIVGINLTRAYTIMARKNGYEGILSVGRVQTPILSLIVNRDKEFENFKSINYYSLLGDFNINNNTIKARFKIVGQEEYEIKRKAKINNKWQEVVKTLKKPIWEVSVIGREKDLKQINKAKTTKKYKIIQDKGVNNERDYTKQYRQRILQELGNKSTIRRETAQERNSMRILSKQPVVHNTKRTQMLLHINALNQLQQGERGRSDNILRWTSARNNEIKRDG